MGPQGGIKLGILQNIGSALIVAIGLGLAIFVHELGHLLAAKRKNVKVDRFSIGFGPRLWGFVRGETEYRLSAIPLGGYVKLAGENPDEEVSDDPRHFMNQKPGVRALVLVAGVTMNVILGIALFALAFQLGYPVGLPEIGDVRPGGPADRAGLRAGDVVVEINGRSPVDAEDLHMAQVLAKPGKSARLTIRRPGVAEPIEINVVAQKDKGDPLPTWGIVPAYTMVVEEIVKGSGTSGDDCVQVGDIVKSADGKPVTEWEELVALMRAAPGTDIPVEVERDREDRLVKLPVGEFKEYHLGIHSGSGAQIVTLVRGSAAERAGLSVGDEIVRIAGKDVRSWVQLRDTLNASGGKTIQVEIVRDGEPHVLEVTPDKRPLQLAVIPGRFSDYLLGVTPKFSLVVGDVDKDSPGWNAGLRAGDLLAAIEVTSKKGKTDTRSIESFSDGLEWGALDQLDRGAGVAVKWTRDGEEMSGKLVAGEARILARIQVFPRSPLMTLDHGPISSMRFGLRKSYYVVVMLTKSIRSMIRGWINAKKNLAGPIGILQISFIVAQKGIIHAMYFFALINVNLAFLNLLPIPILDGGQIVMVGIEKIRGKQLSQKATAVAQYVGLVLILALIVFALYADLSRLLFS